MTKQPDVRSDINYSYYAVAFIDVLGQRESFEGINDFPQPEAPDPDFIKRLAKAHSQTVLVVEKIREGFQDFFDSYTNKEESKEKVPSDKKEQFEEMRKCNLKHQRFSDCILAFASLETKKYHSPALNGVYGILSACG